MSPGSVIGSLDGKNVTVALTISSVGPCDETRPSGGSYLGLPAWQVATLVGASVIDLAAAVGA